MKKTLVAYKSRIAKQIHGEVCELYKAGLANQRTMQEFDSLCLVPVEKPQARAVSKKSESKEKL